MSRDLDFLRKEYQSGAFRPSRLPQHFTLLAKGERDVRDIPDYVSKRDGVYIIVAYNRTYFTYPNGKSRVIYIGKSDDLRRRLGEHRKHLQDVLFDRVASMSNYQRYYYMKAFGAEVYVYYDLRKQEAKDIESMVMNKFFERYYALPVANGARSFKIENN
jgi:hypothetical protein